MDAFFSNRGAYVVLSFVAFAIPAAIVTVAYFWYKLRRDEMLTNLKRELAQCGMGAEEIRTVVEATPPDATGIAEDIEALNSVPKKKTCGACMKT